MSPILSLLLLQAHQPIATIKLETASSVVGRPVKGILSLTFPKGHHGYQNPPADEFENPIRLSVAELGFKMGKVAYPKGTDLKIAGAEKPSKVYAGTIQIPFSVVATKPSPKGFVTNVNFKLDYQLCTVSNCYPPASMIVKAPLKVTK